MTNLLPCPFCGSASNSPTGPRYIKNADMWEGMMHDVHCVECCTTMSDYSREKVEAKWNRRKVTNATGRTPAELVELVRELVKQLKKCRSELEIYENDFYDELYNNPKLNDLISKTEGI